MTARFPEVPDSFGITLAAVTGLAFVFAHAGRAVAVAKPVRAAALEVRRKAERMAEELGAIAVLREEALSLTSESGADLSASDATMQAETMADQLRRVREGLRRAGQAASMLDAALKEAEPFAANIERMMPGWRERTGSAFRETLGQFRREVQRLEAASQSPQFDDLTRALLGRSLAEQGIREWAASLPPEEEPLVDDDDIEPIHWDADRGWLPGLT
jgi:hypothetical protein